MIKYQQSPENNWNLIQTIYFKEQVLGAAISHNSTLLAIVNSKLISIYNLNTLIPKIAYHGQFKLIRDIKFSPSDKQLAILQALFKDSLNILQLDTLELKSYQLTHFTDVPYKIEYVSENQLIVIFNCTLKIFDLLSQDFIIKIASNEINYNFSIKVNRFILIHDSQKTDIWFNIWNKRKVSLSISHDQNDSNVNVGFIEQTQQLLIVHQNRYIAIKNIKQNKLIRKYSRDITAIAFQQNYKFIVMVSKNKLVMYNWSVGECVQTDIQASQLKDILQLSNDTQFLIFGHKQRVKIYQNENKQQ